MKTHSVKVGELTFELRIPEDPELLPTLEIENDASMVFESLDVEHALKLQKLLEEYVSVAGDS